MADSKYIQMNGVDVNHKLGSISARFSTSSPAEMNYTVRLGYSASNPPVVGKPVALYLRGGTKIFGGTIDQVDWYGAFESASYLEIPVKCVGYDNRLYIRTTRSRSTHRCAHYRSFSGEVTTDGTAVVLWDEGEMFNPVLVGKTVVIGGVNKVVASVQNPKQMTMTSTVTAGSNVAWSYTVYSGEVIKDLLDNYADFEGFTYTGTSIQQGAAISEFLFSPPIPIADAIQAVLAINPTFYAATDPDQVFYFAARTLVAAPSNIIDGNGVWKRSMKLTETREDVRNCEISIVDIEKVASEFLTITGDSVSVAWFTDTDKPIGKAVKATLNGVEVSISNDPTSEAAFYFRQDSNEFWQNPLDPILTASDEVILEYKALDSNLDEYADDTARIARAAVEVTGLGRYEEVIDRTSSVGLVEAHAEATGSVTRLKDNYVRGSMTIRDDGYRVGMVFVLTSAKMNINTTMFIDTLSLVDDYAGTAVGEGLDFRYQLEVISLSRRITGSEVLRSLFGGGKGGSSGGGFISGGGGSGGSGGGSIITAFLLVANATITAPIAPTDGQVLTVFITEDATGGWQITYGSDFQNGPIAIDSSPNAVNIITFIGYSGKWWYTGFTSS